MCYSCLDPVLPPAEGFLDQLPAAAVHYTAEITVDKALDALQLPVLLPALIAYLQANPVIRQQLKLAIG